MEHAFGSLLDALHLLFLILALALALGFEFVNGFHDTANAVATVIYTKSLPPWLAVIWSGHLEFPGGLELHGHGGIQDHQFVAGGVGDERVGSGAGFAMVFSMLISAIVWNVLGTR